MIACGLGRNPFVSQVNSNSGYNQFFRTERLRRNPFVSQVNSNKDATEEQRDQLKVRRNPFVSQVNSNRPTVKLIGEDGNAVAIPS